MSSRFTKSTIALLVLGGIGMVVVVGGFLFFGIQFQQTESPPQVPDGYSGYKEMNEVRRIMRVEAERRFVRAKQKVEYGDAEAQFELGNCYRAGVAVAEDQVEAVKWFRKAADQNNILLYTSLASVTVMVGAWRRTMPKRRNGFAKPPMGIFPQPNSVLVIATPMAKALRKITWKLMPGI